jgi:hypothetical protein
MTAKDREMLKKAYGYERAKAQNRIMRIESHYGDKISHLMSTAGTR